MLTVKELKERLSLADDDRIVTIERPDEPENRSDQRYLTPTGGVDIDPADEYFVIYTD